MHFMKLACTTGPASSKDLTAITADVNLRRLHACIAGVALQLPGAASPIEHPITDRVMALRARGRGTCNTDIGLNMAMCTVAKAATIVVVESSCHHVVWQ